MRPPILGELQQMAKISQYLGLYHSINAHNTVLILLTLLHSEWPKLHRVLAEWSFGRSECNRVKGPGGITLQQGEEEFGWLVVLGLTAL